MRVVLLRIPNKSTPVPVKADYFLPQHSVHGLLIHDRILFYHHLYVKVCRQLGQDVFSELIYNFLQLMTVFIKGSLETVVETSLLQTTVSANLGRFSPASHLPGQS